MTPVVEYSQKAYIPLQMPTNNYPSIILKSSSEKPRILRSNPLEERMTQDYFKKLACKIPETNY